MFNTISHTTRGTSDAYLFGYFGNGKGEGQPLDAVTKAAVAKLGFADAVKEALSRTESTGDFCAVTEVFGGKGNVTRILLVGLGTKETFKAACCRGRLPTNSRRVACARRCRRVGST